MTAHKENDAGECDNCEHPWPCPTALRFVDNALYKALLSDDGEES